MGEPKSKLFLLFLCTFTIMVPILIMAESSANEEDNYWLFRAEEAWNHTLKAYKPNPEEITSAFNKHANKWVSNLFSFVS